MGDMPVRLVVSSFTNFCVQNVTEKAIMKGEEYFDLVHV